MSHERKVLASAIQDRKAYEAIAGRIGKYDFTEQANLIWQGIEDYYVRDGDCARCDPDILASEIGRNLGASKHKKEFAAVISDLSETEVSPANVIHDFIAVRRESLGDRLASALMSGKDGPEVLALVEEYEAWARAEDLGEENATVVQGLGFEELVSPYKDENLIRLWPSSLNKRLNGGLVRGHHAVVFARPELGKTLFVVNATAGFLSQEQKVLYVGNEEPREDTISRIIARLTKRTTLDLHGPEGKAIYDQAWERGYGNLVFARLYPGSAREIDDLCNEYKPDVIVLDQLRNITVKGDNFTQQLEKVAMAARNLGKKYNALVLSVTQAGDSASGKAVLDMGDVDSSNTGIPATADVMIGIGGTQEDLEMNRRIISLPKNKRSGIHDHFPVRIDPQTSRITGVD